MAYSILTDDKNVTVSADGVTNSHVGTVYGGLKNTTNNKIDGNIATSLPDVICSLSWCSCSLTKVDNTGAKLVCTVNKNTGSDRTCKILLNYNGNTTSNSVYINLNGQPITSDDVQITFKFINYNSGFSGNIKSIDTILRIIFTTVPDKYHGNPINNTSDPIVIANGSVAASFNLWYTSTTGFEVYTSRTTEDRKYIKKDATSSSGQILAGNTKIYLNIFGTAHTETSNGESNYHCVFMHSNGYMYDYFTLENIVNGSTLEIYTLQDMSNV